MMILEFFLVALLFLSAEQAENFFDVECYPLVWLFMILYVHNLIWVYVLFLLQAGYVGEDVESILYKLLMVSHYKVWVTLGYMDELYLQYDSF